MSVPLSACQSAQSTGLMLLPDFSCKLLFCVLQARREANCRQLLHLAIRWAQKICQRRLLLPLRSSRGRGISQARQAPHNGTRICTGSQKVTCTEYPLLSNKLDMFHSLLTTLRRLQCHDCCLQLQKNCEVQEGQHHARGQGHLLNLWHALSLPRGCCVTCRPSEDQDSWAAIPCAVSPTLGTGLRA